MITQILIVGGKRGDLWLCISIKMHGTVTHKITHLVQEDILNEIPEIKYVIIHSCPIGLNYEHEQEIDKKE